MSSRSMLTVLVAFLVTAVFVSSSCAMPPKPPPVNPADWQYTVQVSGHDSKAKGPVGYLWLPDDVKTVRGLIVAGRIWIERSFTVDPIIRQACAKEGFGILYFEPHVDGVFDYTNKPSAKNLEYALAQLAQTSGHPEVQFVPWITVGHSTGGIYCRNVAYWNPDRVAGVIHIKSGNFQAHICDPSKTLAGVPFLVINGEFEEFGPEGGLRPEYASNPGDPMTQNQTQWIMVRMQILDRRHKNPENLMGLVVHRDNGHFTWDADLAKLCAQFIHSAAAARIPQNPPTGQIVKCLPVKAESGWLLDADIKNPKFPAAAYAEYKGDKTLAFWYVDADMAQAVEQYMKGPWKTPDPTAQQPAAQRFTPPAELQDEVDASAASACPPSPAGN